MSLASWKAIFHSEDTPAIFPLSRPSPADGISAFVLPCWITGPTNLPRKRLRPTCGPEQFCDSSLPDRSFLLGRPGLDGAGFVVLVRDLGLLARLEIGQFRFLPVR
jgi:hypothetical protein